VLFERAPHHVRSLLLDALVTYSDSCTLPNLTPSCPYFVQSEAGPTCREQCRDLMAQSGAADRRVRDVRIGGLVLHGRGMPQAWPAGRCRATLWMTTWTPRGVTVGDDGRLGLDPWQEESVASLA